MAANFAKLPGLLRKPPSISEALISVPAGRCGMI